MQDRDTATAPHGGTRVARLLAEGRGRLRGARFLSQVSVLGFVPNAVAPPNRFTKRLDETRERVLQRDDQGDLGSGAMNLGAQLLLLLLFTIT